MVVPVRGGPWAAAAKRSLVGLVAIAIPVITMVAYVAWCVANVAVLVTRKDGRSLYDQIAGTCVVSVARSR